jgi:site-specific DNA-methyltransferase (cytosine-N4-specific)
MVRPSTLLHLEADFSPNPAKHPARFPLTLPTFFVNLLTLPGQLVVDPFGGTGTTGLAAEKLGRRWLVAELDQKYAEIVPSRFAKGR